MIYLKDSIGNKSEEYEKHSKLAQSMDSKELYMEEEKVLVELHILQAIHNAYDHQISNRSLNSQGTQEDYWQD